MRSMIVFLLLIVSITSRAEIRSASLTASGLTCSMCSKAIYKSLEKLSFVESIKADIKSSTYTIRFRNGANVDPDLLAKAVKDAGFSVAKLQLVVNFKNEKIQNDAHIENAGHVFHFVNVPAQTMSGDKTITLVDKAFTSDKEHRRVGKFTNLKCYETGRAAACCTSLKTGARIYHVTI